MKEDEMQLTEAFAVLANRSPPDEDRRQRLQAWTLVYGTLQDIARRQRSPGGEESEDWEDTAQRTGLKVHRSGLPADARSVSTERQVLAYLTRMLVNQRRDQWRKERRRRERETPLIMGGNAGEGTERDLLETHDPKGGRAADEPASTRALRRMQQTDRCSDATQAASKVRATIVRETPSLEEAAVETLTEALTGFQLDESGADPEVGATSLAFVRLAARAVAGRKAQVRRDMPRTLRDMVRLWSRESCVRELVDALPEDSMDSTLPTGQRFVRRRDRLYKRFERVRDYLEAAVPHLTPQEGLDPEAQADRLRQMIDLFRFRASGEATRKDDPVPGGGEP